MPPPPPQILHMDKPCEICGNIGYAECIRICHKCKITREHAYCMRRVYRGDSNGWVCEDCVLGDKKILSSKPVPSKQLSDITSRSNIRKPPQNTKVQYISPEEAMGLESGSQKCSPGKSYVSYKPKANRIFASGTEAGKCKTSPSKFIAKPNSHIGPTGFTQLQSARSPRHTLQDKVLPAWKDKGKRVVQNQRDQQNSPLVIRLSAKKPRISNATLQERDKRTSRQLYTTRDTSAEITLPPEKNSNPNTELAIENPEQALVCSVEHLPTVSSGVGICADTQTDSFGSDGKEPLGVALDLDRYLPNHPAEFPTWKGRINIMGSDDALLCRSLDGIQAHPPCKVHRKAYDLSKQLPKALQVELIPRVDIWVNLFGGDDPGALDIGLYFLSPEGSVENLTSVVEFLDEHDMLLRSKIDGVELLFLSSRHLSKDSQRINQTFFLWGLFRRCEDNVDALEAAENSVSGSSKDLDEDMDIDMIGGHEVGIIDKVIAQQAENSSPRPTVPEPTPLHLQNLSEFESVLQRCLDRFTMLKKPK